MKAEFHLKILWILVLKIPKLSTNMGKQIRPSVLNGEITLEKELNQIMIQKLNIGNIVLILRSSEKQIKLFYLWI